MTRHTLKASKHLCINRFCAKLLDELVVVYSDLDAVYDGSLDVPRRDDLLSACALILCCRR